MTDGASGAVATARRAGEAQMFRVGGGALEVFSGGQGELQMKLPGLASLPEAELVSLLRNRQSAARFTWKPVMHNPKLRRLARIDRPTLVLWGESDRIVRPGYGRAYARLIPGARFQPIPAAGHYPYLERPSASEGEVRV